MNPNLLFSYLNSQPSQPSNQPTQSQTPVVAPGQNDITSSTTSSDPFNPAVNNPLLAQNIANSARKIPFNNQALQAQNAAISDPSGKSDLSSIGKALDGHDWVGLCEAWQEKQTYGKTGIYPTASAAFQNYAQKGQAFNNISQAKAGDLVYFSGDSSNGNAGHVGIITDPAKGIMQSATNSGVRQDNIGKWLQNTGQTIAGFVHP